MTKEQKVIEYYILCNTLKNVIRTGWENWQVKTKRVESVAEHIFGTQMLAIAIASEFDYEIDLKKVLFMLAVHELEEIFIGDLTMFDISKKEKQKLGREAVCKVLKNLKNKKEIKSLICEFEERKTNEAQFAFCCDKLEADLQCKLYDEQNCVDLSNLKMNKALKNEEVQHYLKSNKSWSEMWMEFGRKKYCYDKNFSKISLYAEKHRITKCENKETKTCKKHKNI